MTEPTDAEKLAYLTYDAQHPETRRSSAAPAGLLREADKMEAELLEATRATRRAPNIVLLSWRETVRDLRAALAATGDSGGPLDVDAQFDAIDSSLLVTFQWSDKQHERYGLAAHAFLRRLNEIGWTVARLSSKEAGE